MIHGTKSNRFRNGRAATTSQSGNDILAKARKEREQREQQKLKVQACTRIQNKIKLYLFRKKWYADFMNGILIPQMYDKLTENKKTPVIPHKLTHAWLFDKELKSGFSLLEKLTKGSTMTADFFFYEMFKWLAGHLEDISVDNAIRIINILLDSVDNDAVAFHKSVDELLLLSKEQSSRDDTSVTYPCAHRYYHCDLFMMKITQPIYDSAIGEDVVKRLFKSVITPGYAMMMFLLSTRMSKFIFTEYDFEFMTPTDDQIQRIKQAPISNLELIETQTLGIFEPFFLVFSNYTSMFVPIINHVVESSSLQQMHELSVNVPLDVCRNYSNNVSILSYTIPMDILFKSIIDVKQNDLNYIWILYHLFQLYDHFHGNCPYYFPKDSIFDISNAENIYKTLPIIEKLETYSKSHFEILFCYYNMRKYYNGYEIVIKILYRLKGQRILEFLSNSLDIKAILYLYSRLPTTSSAGFAFIVRAIPDDNSLFMFPNLFADDFDKVLVEWKTTLNEYNLYVLKKFNGNHYRLDVNLDRDRIESSTIASMMTITHSVFDVHYKDERGRGDGLRKQFLSDSTKLFFIKSKMFEIDYEKGEIWPSTQFFDLSMKDIFSDSSTQYLHHKSLIELAGKTLALLMVEGFQCPFKFSRAFLMKFSSRLLLKMDVVKCLDFNKPQFDHLDFVDLNLKDEDLFKQLLSLTNLSVEDLDSMELFMEYKDCSFGNYQGMPVNKDNLTLYIESIVRYEMNNTKIEKFLDYFVAGFERIIPVQYAINLLPFARYNCEFLSKLISGDGHDSFPTKSFIESLTLEGYDKADSTIRYLCEILEDDMSDKERWAFFEFVTSMAMLPTEGVGAMKPRVCIARTKGYDKGMNLYPVASTCVNMLILPDYQNKEELLEKINYVIENEHRFHLD